MARIKSRVVWIVALLSLAIIGVAAAWRLWPSQEQVLILPDGSKVTLLRVTHGTNHVCYHKFGWQELVYPLLPKRLKQNLSQRVAKFPTEHDSLMVWFREDMPTQKSVAFRGALVPHFYFGVVSDSGIESDQVQVPNSASLNSNPNGFYQVYGWMLQSYPRRSKELRLRVYRRDIFGKTFQVGEFAIQNPVIKDYPVWPAESLPIARQTNDVEITLTKFETGLMSKRTGLGPAGVDSKCFSRATFQFKENGTSTEKWSVFGITAKNTAGDFLPGESFNPRWMRGEHVVDFSGGLWLDEPAWLLNVELARTDDFPAGELWTITGVRIPTRNEIAETRIVTTRSGRELEFLGVSGSAASFPDQFTGIRPHANLHLRAPFPLTDWHLSLVDIKDDRGKQVRRHGVCTAPSIVGGATVKHLLYGFAFDVPDDAKSLNVTFAITPSRHVQFVAKPTLFNE